VRPKAEWLARMRQGPFVCRTIVEESTTLETDGDPAHLVVRTVTDATVHGPRADRQLGPAIDHARKGDRWVVLRTEATTW
jgi:hypothetical protein